MGIPYPGMSYENPYQQNGVVFVHPLKKNKQPTESQPEAFENPKMQQRYVSES